MKSSEHPLLFSSYALLDAHAVSWVSGSPPLQLQQRGGRMRLQCRLRHRQPLRQCEAQRTADDTLRVLFTNGLERAVCEGQVLALYDGMECLGGAAVARAQRPWEPQEQAL